MNHLIVLLDASQWVVVVVVALASVGLAAADRHVAGEANRSEPTKLAAPR